MSSKGILAVDIVKYICYCCFFPLCVCVWWEGGGGIIVISKKKKSNHKITVIFQ